MSRVPEGWTIEPLEKLASVERGKFSARPRNDPRYYGGTIPFVQTGDIREANTWLTTYSQTLNDRGLSISRLFPSGTILITIAANIGDVALTTFEVACPDSLVAIQPYEDTSAKWLLYILSTQKAHLEYIAAQNAQKNINLQILRPLKIVTPPLPEQRKIAQILSTWDEAIALVEHLTAALQQRKQGLMQRLLTGEVRFPGFDGEWEDVQLGDFLENVRRKIEKPNSAYTRMGLRSHGKGTFTEIVEDPSSNAMDFLYEVKSDDLIVNITFAWEQAIAIVSDDDDGALVSHRFPTYEFDRDRAISEFFRYLMLTKRFLYQLDLITPGGAGRNRVMSKTGLPPQK